MQQKYITCGKDSFAWQICLYTYKYFNQLPVSSHAAYKFICSSFGLHKDKCLVFLLLHDLFQQLDEPVRKRSKRALHCKSLNNQKRQVVHNLQGISRQLPRRTIPHRTGFGPDEWFYSVVVVLVGSCPGGE